MLLRKQGHFFLITFLPHFIKRHMTKSRRKFIQQMSGTALAMAAGNFVFADAWQNRVDSYSKNISPNDKTRIATIGMGIMGFNDTNTALKVPGTELVAVADLYNGRLE